MTIKTSLDRPEDSNADAQVARVWPIPELIENTHYYFEDGLMVFTEEYHLCRGRCCGNACRHCPFEHVNVRPKPE